MTNHGSSLFQARKSHLLRRSLAVDSESLKRDTGRLSSHADHHQPRQFEAAALEHSVVEVVQTVSIVQVIDSHGGVVEVQTLYEPGPPTEPAEVTVPPEGTVPPEETEPAPADAPSGDPAYFDTLLPVSLDLPTVEVPSIEVPTSFPLDTLLPSLGPTPLTSAPSTNPSITPSLFGDSGSGSSSLSSSGSTGPHYTNGTQFNGTASRLPFANTTRTSSTSASLFRSSTLLFPETSTGAAVATAFPGDQGFDAGSTVAAGPGPLSTHGSGTSGSPPPAPTSTVVGSVLGSVAGVALLVAVALFLLRWKKRQQHGIRLLEDTNGRPRALSGGPGPAGSGMTDHSLPFAIPSALAALSGKHKPQGPSLGAESAEKGFYRVSGRRLPPVLMHGGDGFTDPRDSMASGQTTFRDSQGFWEPSTPSRFAVGSPMRPESGVMIMQPGPGRTPVQTPVTEQRPFFDDLDSQLTPPAGIDPIGRSHLSQDGSRGSGSASRFTEEI